LFYCPFTSIPLQQFHCGNFLKLAQRTFIEASHVDRYTPHNSLFDSLRILMELFGAITVFLLKVKPTLFRLARYAVFTAIYYDSTGQFFRECTYKITDYAKEKLHWCSMRGKSANIHVKLKLLHLAHDFVLIKCSAMGRRLDNWRINIYINVFFNCNKTREKKKVLYA
jgi:hypothetical protein